MDNQKTKYRVWCEFTIDGEKHCEMAGPENWFLLTQTGNLMSHGPMSFDPNVEKKYDKLVVEFYAGLKDKNGNEIYEGDILYLVYETLELTGKVEQEENGKWILYKDKGNFVGVYNNKDRVEIIGNIHENPELRKPDKQ